MRQDGYTTTYAYNAQGDRTSQTVNGEQTKYLLDPVGLTQVIAETTAGGLDRSRQTSFYVSGLAQYQGDAWTYQLADGLGSVRQMVDGDVTVTLAQTYDPFGNVLEQHGAGSSGFGYTGEQSGSRLVYLRARWYDPVTGRFLTQ